MIFFTLSIISFFILSYAGIGKLILSLAMDREADAFARIGQGSISLEKNGANNLRRLWKLAPNLERPLPWTPKGLGALY